MSAMSDLVSSRQCATLEEFLKRLLYPFKSASHGDDSLRRRKAANDPAYCADYNIDDERNDEHLG
jgi:hypothetical protein